MKFRGVRPVFVRTISDAYIPIVCLRVVQSPINAYLCICYRGAGYICDGILSVAQTMEY